MSFSETELSRDSGRPIELYEISYTANRWYYTSADTDIMYNNTLYKAVPCGSEEIQASDDPTDAAITITFPATIPFAQLFIMHPPSEIVSLRLLEQHYEQLDGYATKWQGRITNCDFKGPWAEMSAQSTVASRTQLGLRRETVIGCPHTLYKRSCRANASDFMETSIVSGINGTSVNALAASGKPDDWYAGGYITWTNNLNLNTESRMIRRSVGSTGELVLSWQTVGLKSGEIISMYPGCNRTTDHCENKFNNILNYGGMPYSPTVNPFTGAILY